MDVSPVKWGYYRRMLHSWRGGWICLLFLCVGILSSCGTSSTPTTISQQPLLPTATQPIHSTATTLDGDFTISLDITPGRSGTNVFLAHVTDTRTHASTAQVTVTLYTTMLDMAMGTDSIMLHASKNGQYSATGNILSMGGHWAIGIAIQTPDHHIHKAGISLLLPL